MKWVYRIHGWTGLITGPLLIVVCLSGGLVVFKPQIDRATDARLGRVSPSAAPTAPAGPPALDAAMRALREQRAEARPLAIALPVTAESMLSHGRRIGMQVRADGQRFGMYFHPRTGELIGRRPLGDGWGQWLRTLHINLFLGSFGRVFVGVLGVTMILSSVTGLLIYRRFNGGRWWPRLRRGRTVRILWGEWHRLIGAVTLLFALMFAASGAVLGLEVLTPLHALFIKQHPGEVTPRSQWPGDVLTDAVRAAEARMPESRAVAITMPRPNDAVLRVYMNHPTGALVKEFVSNVAVDPATGEVVQVFDARRRGWLTRLYLAMEPIHFGRLGGAMWVMVLWAAMGVALGALILTGSVIYFLRRGKRRGRRDAPLRHVSQLDAQP